jgi:SPW repeat
VILWAFLLHPKAMGANVPGNQEVAMRKGQALRGGQALIVLFGLWLAMSPWIVGYANHAHALLDTIVGIFVVGAGIASALWGPATAVPLWMAFVLGMWTFLTPIAFGEVGHAFSANNDLMVGPLIALSASIAIVTRENMRIAATNAKPHSAADQTSLE